MSLELTGKLLQKLPVQSGQSAKGPWSRQEFVLETQETYPRKVCASVWGVDKVNELATFSEGTLIKVTFNLESRQFNDRWYTDVRAWRIERILNQENVSSSFTSESAPVPFSDPSFLDTSSEVDDLPF